MGYACVSRCRSQVNVGSPASSLLKKLQLLQWSPSLTSRSITSWQFGMLATPTMETQTRGSWYRDRIYQQHYCRKSMQGDSLSINEEYSQQKLDQIAITRSSTSWWTRTKRSKAPQDFRKVSGIEFKDTTQKPLVRQLFHQHIEVSSSSTPSCVAVGSTFSLTNIGL